MLVLPQAVPAELHQAACALVHCSLGRPGAIIDGGFDCMGALDEAKGLAKGEPRRVRRTRCRVGWEVDSMEELRVID